MKFLLKFKTINKIVKLFIIIDLIKTSPNVVIMLGEKLKELRESKGLVQRQVAAELEVDTAYISKMESNEKPVSRQHLKKLSVMLGIAEDELQTLWLADKVFDVLKNEDMAIGAMHLAKEKINLNKKN